MHPTTLCRANSSWSCHVCASGRVAGLRPNYKTYCQGSKVTLLSLFSDWIHILWIEDSCSKDEELMRKDVKRICAVVWGRRIVFIFIFKDISIVMCEHTFWTAGLTFPTSQASTTHQKSCLIDFSRIWVPPLTLINVLVSIWQNHV